MNVASFCDTLGQLTVADVTRAADVGIERESNSSCLIAEDLSVKNFRLHMSMQGQVQSK